MRVDRYTVHLDDNKFVTLVKESGTNYPSLTSLSSSDKVVNMMNDLFFANKQTEEHVWMIACDTKCKPIGVFEISHGVINGSFSNPREMFVRLCLCNAYGFILIHNHPSGDPTPSHDDISMTKRVKQASDLLGFTLLDHIVIGDDYTSFADSQML